MNNLKITVKATIFSPSHAKTVDVISSLAVNYIWERSQLISKKILVHIHSVIPAVMFVSNMASQLHAAQFLLKS